MTDRRRKSPPAAPSIHSIDFSIIHPPPPSTIRSSSSSPNNNQKNKPSINHEQQLAESESQSIAPSMSALSSIATLSTAVIPMNATQSRHIHPAQQKLREQSPDECNPAKSGRCMSKYSGFHGINESCYHHGPMVLNRQPQKLFNQNIGAKYLTTGQVSKADDQLMINLQETALYTHAMVWTTMYRNRNNLIPGPQQLADEEIEKIFTTPITSWKFSVIEYYKRFMMRTRNFNRNINASDQFNWSSILEVELQAFIKYLGTFNTKRIQIYQFGKDDHQSYYFKIVKNKLTLALIQLINVTHDFCQNWNLNNIAQEWMKSAHPGTYIYNPC